MIANLTSKLKDGQNLTENEMSDAMNEILSERISDEKKAEFLRYLGKKGESDDELYAMLGKMDEYSLHILPRYQGTLIDVCGTGGDSMQTFNISTTASFVISALGGFVAKHGNRSVSGASGSADIFEYFGYDLNATPEKITKIIEKFKIGFLFAQRFHPAMKNVANARKILGTKTAFNLLGPLSNPASVKNQLIGVFSDEYLQRIILILKRRGSENIMTVHAQDGLDELSTTAKNNVCFLHDGKIEKMIIDSEKLGLHKSVITDLQVSTRQEAIMAFLSVLNGTSNRSMQEITVLNAAGGLVVANIAKSFDEGVEMASQAIKDGKAYSHFVNFIKGAGDLQKIKEVEEL